MNQADSHPSYHTLHEILDQPAAWQAVLESVERQAAEVRELWQAQPIAEVIFTGCGSPYFLARTAAAIYQSAARARAQAHPASDLMLFPDAVLGPDGARLLVAISRSGETTEILRAVDAFSSGGHGPAIAITCVADSQLASGLPLSLVADRAMEVGLAQTRSFTSMLLAAQGLIFTLAGRPLGQAFLRLPESGAAVIEAGRPLARRLAEQGELEQFFFLGSGPLYGLACEAMLKMKEMSLSVSEAYQFLEFRHGPKSMVDSRSLVVGLVSETALDYEAAVLAEMRELGATVLAITPSPLPAEGADEQLVLPAGLSDLERGPLYLPILQLLAYYRAVHKGLNPDRPHNLSAVVILDQDEP